MSKLRARKKNTIERGSKWSGEKHDQDKFHFLHHFAGVPSYKKYSAVGKLEIIYANPLFSRKANGNQIK